MLLSDPILHQPLEQQQQQQQVQEEWCMMMILDKICSGQSRHFFFDCIWACMSFSVMMGLFSFFFCRGCVYHKCSSGICINYGVYGADADHNCSCCCKCCGNWGSIFNSMQARSLGASSCSRNNINKPWSPTFCCRERWQNKKTGLSEKKPTYHRRCDGCQWRSSSSSSSSD